MELMRAAQDLAQVQDESGLPGRLAAICGTANVLSGFAQRLPYARDRLPFATFAVRDGALPGTLPRLVVRPADEGEVASILRLARAEDVPVIPFGAGSGVLGGAIPLGGEVTLDLKRLDRLLHLNEVNGLATVQAGMNGGRFEVALNDRGWTCGHLPQSLHMSTVGGWAACRGAGQASTRFGKIEDIVVGLRAVLPDGEVLEVRPVARRSSGPSLRDLLVGSEGTLGVITEVTLRIWRRPEVELPAVLAFPSVAAGLDAARRILQGELRPAVLRIYDEEESAPRAGGLPAFGERPVLGIFQFCGPRRLADVEREMALEIVREAGGIEAGSDAPYEHWLAHRYESYSAKWQNAGHWMDTIEVTLPWDQLSEGHAAMRAAALSLCDGMHFGAHWSHAYPEGACQYMTLRLPPMERDRALRLHREAWDRIQRMTLERGGSIAHHHGAGLFRGPYMEGELGTTGLRLLQAVKDALDPGNLLNPGKLGLRPRAGADLSARGTDR